jgi:toxin ParE1/3/4
MKKNAVFLTHQAENDLKSIFEYVAITLFEPEIASNLIQRIEQAIISLEYMPERFRLYEKAPWFNIGLRQMPIDNFVIFYIPRVEDQTVTIIRIMYDGRNIEEHLGKRSD